MVKRENKTIKMITTNEEEILEKMVDKNHAFRKLNVLFENYGLAICHNLKKAVKILPTPIGA